MLLLKERPVYAEYNAGDVYLFPGVKASLKWSYGKNFYRDQDRYGRSRLWLLFPIGAKIEKNSLAHDESYNTFLLWGKKIEVSSPLAILTIPDWDCPIQNRYYHLVSAPKGTQVIVKDEDGDEMELTF